MRFFGGHRLVLVGALALLGGCVTPPVPQVSPDAALLAKWGVADEERTPARVALLVPEAARDAVADVRFGGSAVVMQVQAGAIVAAAMKVALGDGLQGGVQQVSAAPTRGDRYDAMLVIESVRFGFDRKFLWLIPIPVPFFPFILPLEKFEVSTTLVVELRVLDAQGRPAWMRSYLDDAGRFEVVAGNELKESFGRVAHESAARLSRQALGDLRGWLVAERRKPREM